MNDTADTAEITGALDDGNYRYTITPAGDDIFDYVVVYAADGSDTEVAEGTSSTLENIRTLMDAAVRVDQEIRAGKDPDLSEFETAPPQSSVPDDVPAAWEHAPERDTAHAVDRQMDPDA
jgi:hypothetical protein